MTRIARSTAAMLVMIVLTSVGTQAQNTFNVKEYLRRIEYYKYANVSVFEADSTTALRFRETFTPLTPKTTAVEEAERECSVSAQIWFLLRNKQSVPASLLEVNRSACETVLEFARHSTKEAEERIGRVFIVTAKYKSGTEPILVGAVSIEAGTFIQQADPDFLKSSLNSPLAEGTLSSAELQRFATQEQSNSAKGSIKKPLGKTMLEHCAASIKQGMFKDITAELRPTFSPEVAYLAKKGVFTVQPRGILPLPKSVATLTPECAALTTIDDEALPYLTRWQVLEPRLIATVRGYFFQQQKFPTDTTVIITGEKRRTGKYEIYELRCGNEVATKKDLDNTMLQGVKDQLSEPISGWNEGKEDYCHDALTIAFRELPLPVNIDDLLAAQKQQAPAGIKKVAGAKDGTLKPKKK